MGPIIHGLQADDKRIDFTEQIESSYGIDEEGLISEESHINVPESSLIIPVSKLIHWLLVKTMA